MKKIKLLNIANPYILKDYEKINTNIFFTDTIPSDPKETERYLRKSQGNIEKNWQRFCKVMDRNLNR